MRRGLWGVLFGVATVACASERAAISPSSARAPIARTTSSALAPTASAPSASDAPEVGGHPPGWADAAEVSKFALTLPIARDPYFALPGQTERITVSGDKVLLWDVVVDNISAVRKGHSLRRLDGLYHAVRSVTRDWEKSNPGKSGSVPGVAVLQLDANLETRIVKCVFQTAAFAGYPVFGISARRTPSEGRIGVLIAGAFRGHGLPVRSPQPTLIVDVERRGISLLRAADSSEVPTLDVHLPLPESADQRAEFARAIASEWREHGIHHERSDPEYDQAIIRIADDLPLRVLIATLDDVLETQREFPSQEAGTGFLTTRVYSVTVAIGPPGGKVAELDPTADPVRGRLPPETVQEILRSHYDELQACYEAGRVHAPRLTGRVDVRFVIEMDGRVSSASSLPQTNLRDRNTVACIVDAYKRFVFPIPFGVGRVTVDYANEFSPGVIKDAALTSGEH